MVLQPEDFVGVASVLWTQYDFLLLFYHSYGQNKRKNLQSKCRKHVNKVYLWQENKPHNAMIHVFRRNFTTIDYIHCTESHLCPQKAKRKLAAIGPQYFLSDNIG